MNIKRFSLTILSLLCLNACVHTSRAQAATLQTFAKTAYPLFGKDLRSPEARAMIIKNLLLHKSYLQSGALVCGGIALLICTYYALKNWDRGWRFQESLASGAILGISIPLASYLVTELCIIPTIGFDTMLAGV